MLIIIMYLINTCIKDNCDVRMLKWPTATPMTPREREKPEKKYVKTIGQMWVLSATLNNSLTTR